MSRSRVLGWVVTIVLAVGISLACCALIAGEIPLRWDPVTPPANCGTLGYYVYSGGASGAYGSLGVDAGNVANFTLGSQADCSNAYVAVKAYCRTASGELLSPSFSNEIAGLPRLYVSTTVPAQLTAPTSGTVDVVLAINGANYQTGMMATTDYPGLAVVSTAFTDCRNALVTLRVSSTIQPGSATLTLENPSGVYNGLALDVGTQTVLVPVVTGLERADSTEPPPVEPPPLPGVEVILDNDAPGTVREGYWPENGLAGYVRYGVNARRSYYDDSTAGGPLDSYTWNLTLPAAGTYDVYAWWKGTTALYVAEALYTLNGQAVPPVSQQVSAADGWNFLGRVTVAGTGLAVVLDSNPSPATTADNSVADAVKAVAVQP